MCGPGLKAAVSCTVCEENCHYPGCILVPLNHCEVFRDGLCTSCTNKCPASDHVKEKWRYVTRIRSGQKNKTRTKKKDVDVFEKEMKLLTAEKSQFLDESYQHVVRLEQITLKADSASAIVHLDFLIEKIKERGDTDNVQKLEEMRRREDEGIRGALRISLISSPHEDIISDSFLIRSGPPAVYQLRAKKQKTGTLTRMTVGEKRPNKPNRTILLVGETGAGKSTLINALLNYTMGVKWEDEVWFMIAEEERRSQTSDVVVYEIFGFEDETLPYSLTIINTPGYGDTRGTEHDDTISYRLLDLFQSDDGVHEVHAVGLVMKASVNRLSEPLRYVFDSVMSLFGKDVEKNIIALITHSDGSRPENPLQALEAANIKCAKNEDSQPAHFLFNNCQLEERMEENTIFRNSWELTQTNMDHLTDLLGKSNPQKLVKTAEVLNERIRLKASIQNLEDRFELAELKQTEIREIREALKQTNHRNKIEIEKILSLLENLEKEMKVLTAEKEKWLSDSYQHAVRLEEIALKADSASTVVHLDFLIEKMKEEGDTEKVQKLEEMRREDGGTKESQRYKLGQTTSASKNIGRPSLWYK
ncbi:uncharacterized protein LOC113018441 [Astatotilapia calliptera]|nr:uncharacterized protein LOC113018441 [Astatotilapia calliptera]